MKHSLSLNEGKVVYEFDNAAKWEKDGKTFEFISFKKITAYKENKKYQNLTVSKTDWEDFARWMDECLSGNVPAREPGADVPF